MTGETFMQPKVQDMLQKLEHLTPARLAEVEDFIDFLRQRDSEQRLQQDFAQSSSASFAKVWDNDGDAAYDCL